MTSSTSFHIPKNPVQLNRFVRKSLPELPPKVQQLLGRRHQHSMVLPRHAAGASGGGGLLLPEMNGQGATHRRAVPEASSLLHQQPGTKRSPTLLRQRHDDSMEKLRLLSQATLVHGDDPKTLLQPYYSTNESRLLHSGVGQSHQHHQEQAALSCAAAVPYTMVHVPMVLEQRRRASMVGHSTQLPMMHSRTTGPAASTTTTTRRTTEPAAAAPPPLPVHHHDRPLLLYLPAELARAQQQLHRRSAGTGSSSSILLAQHPPLLAQVSASSPDFVVVPHQSSSTALPSYSAGVVWQQPQHPTK